VELQHRLEALLTLAEHLGIDVRAETMGGDGGGLCKLRGAWVLFVDTTADLATRYDRTLTAMVARTDLDDHYLPPEVRDDLERQRQIISREQKS
jgi:hypothetical protein